MALPSTGAISMSQVATELGISSTGLSMNDSRVRNLAGKTSGTISMSDLRGKSANAMLTIGSWVTSNIVYYGWKPGKGGSVSRTTIPTRNVVLSEVWWYSESYLDAWDTPRGAFGFSATFSSGTARYANIGSGRINGSAYTNPLTWTQSGNSGHWLSGMPKSGTVVITFT